MSKLHLLQATDANRDPNSTEELVSALGEAELEQVAGGYLDIMVDGEWVRIYPRRQN